jgi:hypothetical protein
MLGWGWEINTGIRCLNESRVELPQGSSHELPTCSVPKPSGSFFDARLGLGNQYRHPLLV